jgi:predicted TIM-barrel fold metal-dependent hydrolase
MRYELISADSHINEHPDLWQIHLPEKFKSRGPRTVDSSNGGQGFTLEGQSDDPLESGLALGATAVVYRSTKRYDRANFRRRFEEYNLGYGKKGVRYEDILAGSFDPAARIAEQKEDGVDAEVLYNNPLIWAAIKELADNELKLACFQAYNDWIAEYNSYAPDRLLGGGLVPDTGIDDAVAETRRCVEVLGLKSVTMESYPNGSPEEPSSEDDRLWAYVEEAGIPIGVHIGFSFSHKEIRQAQEKGRVKSGMLSGMSPDERPQPGAEPASWKGRFSGVLRRLLLAGVFERHPRLKFIGAEVNCGWIPNYLRELDTRFRYGLYPDAKLDLLPSEYFHRNVFVTFLPDYFGVRARHDMLENIMWSSDFPHSVSNWPIDGEIAYDIIKQNDVPTEEAERILWKNCADLYRLDYDAA